VNEVSHPTLTEGDIVTLADHLGVDVRHVRRLVAERRLPFIKWGHLLRFDPVEIASWLEDKRCQRDRQAAGW
jgi:excisionase family DNA binding protein